MDPADEAEEEAEDESVILIPCRNADEEVEVAVDELPEDVSEVIDLLKAEIAPLKTWIRFAVEVGATTTRTPPQSKHPLDLLPTLRCVLIDGLYAKGAMIDSERHSRRINQRCSSLALRRRSLCIASCSTTARAWWRSSSRSCARGRYPRWRSCTRSPSSSASLSSTCSASGGD